MDLYVGAPPVPQYTWYLGIDQTSDIMASDFVPLSGLGARQHRQRSITHLRNRADGTMYITP
jgi:hypothetical protein